MKSSGTDTNTPSFNRFSINSFSAQTASSLSSIIFFSSTSSSKGTPWRNHVAMSVLSGTQPLLLDKRQYSSLGRVLHSWSVQLELGGLGLVLFVHQLSSLICTDFCIRFRISSKRWHRRQEPLVQSPVTQRSCFQFFALHGVQHLALQDVGVAGVHPIRGSCNWRCSRFAFVVQSEDG